MPRKFQTVLFWFDGAFTTSVSAQIVNILRPELSSAEKLDLQQKIRLLQQDLTIGRMDALDFCHRAVTTCQAKFDPAQLSNRLIETAELNQPFFDIYQQIDAENDPRVIVDIPEIWFRKSNKTLESGRCFSGKASHLYGKVRT